MKYFMVVLLFLCSNCFASEILDCLQEQIEPFGVIDKTNGSVYIDYEKATPGDWVLMENDGLVRKYTLAAIKESESGRELIWRDEIVKEKIINTRRVSHFSKVYIKWKEWFVGGFSVIPVIYPEFWLDTNKIDITYINVNGKLAKFLTLKTFFPEGILERRYPLNFANPDRQLNSVFRDYLGTEYKVYPAWEDYWLVDFYCQYEELFVGENSNG